MSGKHAGLVRVNTDMVRDILALPKECEITSIWMDHSKVPAEIIMRVEGDERLPLVQYGHFIPEVDPQITRGNDGWPKFVNWGNPSDHPSPVVVK